MHSGITIWHKILVWWVHLYLMLWGLKMKHLWVLHGAKQVHFWKRYNYSTKGKNSEKEKVRTNIYLVSGGNESCSSELPLHCYFPLPFWNADTHMCLLISKHGVTTCSKGSEKEEKKNIKNEGRIKTLPTYLVKAVAF